MVHDDGRFFWAHEASAELLEFTEKWMEKWVPKLVTSRKDNEDHYLGDTSDDALAAAELLHLFMLHLSGLEIIPGTIRNGNAREFMEPEELWDVLKLPPEEDED